MSSLSSLRTIDRAVSTIILSARNPASPFNFVNVYEIQSSLRQNFPRHHSFQMAKRKRPEVNAAASVAPALQAMSSNLASVSAATSSRRTSSRRASHLVPPEIDTNPNTNKKIEDGQSAFRASPDAEQLERERPRGGKRNRKPSSLNHLEAPVRTAKTLSAEDIKIRPQESPSPKPQKLHNDGLDKEDPEARDGGDGEEEADPEELKDALSRPPPVNSSYLPLPWKGRLGYACLNTYLRTANPPVFSSRTCRIASILEHRHPLKDPSQPEHATKNRPDKDQPADVARGQGYVEALGIANARDIVKMLRWNDRYGIKFLRLSSEMFPFASHDVYGYKLAPFASEALKEAGRVAGELGHRLTTHPGQFTQLGSPRKEVIAASIRDLEYHCELLDLLKLPEQQNRDAVMILHMGDVFGDKGATIARFKDNYLALPQGVKNRLVLENDDVCYSVHDLLPVCEELNIPFVLDFHHNNIMFDQDQIREGTHDIMELFPRIKATWDRKRITPKMHYSEPTPSAITGRQRRKHNPRVATLPPCAPDMDLMIEAKDKEQAVFELMRTFKLPGFHTFSDVLPHTRNDENKPWKPPGKAKAASKKKNKATEIEDGIKIEDDEHRPPPIVPDDEVGMGGPEGRVYWPPGMEEWLRPKKREVKARDPMKAKTTAERAAAKRAEKAEWQARQEAANNETDTSLGPSSQANPGQIPSGPALDMAATKSVYQVAKDGVTKRKPARTPKSKGRKGVVLTPSASSDAELREEDQDGQDEDVSMGDLTDAEPIATTTKAPGKRPLGSRASSGRLAKKQVVNYADDDDDD